MNRNQGIFVLTILVAFGVITLNQGGIPNQGKQVLLSDYILISTAIFVIAFAVIAIQRDMFEKIRSTFDEIYVTKVPVTSSHVTGIKHFYKTLRSNDWVLYFSTVSTFLSITALYFSYLVGDATIIVRPLFYFATAFVIISIFEMVSLASLLIPIGKDYNQ
jgi:hypothetical protein